MTEMSASESRRSESASHRNQPFAKDRRRSNAFVLAGLLLLGVALPFVIGLSAGSLVIPRNDDWVYRQIATELATTGSLALHSVTTMLVGQIIVVQPLLWLSGLQPWAFAIAGVLFAVGGVFASYLLACQFVKPTRAALATLVLLLFPGYLAYATSFMTDVPALAAELGCLALGAVALRHRPVRIKWLVASGVLGIFAFSIREFGIAAPASVILCAILAEPRRWRLWGLALAVLSCIALLYLLKATLPDQVLGGGVGAGPATPFALAPQLPRALASTALALLPAALIGAIWWRDVWKRRDVGIGAALGLAVVATSLLSSSGGGARSPVRLEDLASPLGAPGGGYLIGFRPLLVSQASWHAIDGLALLAIVVVLSVGVGIAGVRLRQGGESIAQLIRGLGSPIGLLVLFSCFLAVGLTAYGLRWPLYDRYVWPLIPVIAILFLYRPQRGTRSPSRHDSLRAIFVASAATVISLFLAVALLFALNSYAFDSARWRAGGQLVEFGFTPDDIDAGYEWVGTHATSPASSSPIGGGETFYQTWWPTRRTCAIVTNGMQDGNHLLGTVDYSLYLFAGPVERLYMYAINGTDCPAS